MAGSRFPPVSGHLWTWQEKKGESWGALDLDWSPAPDLGLLPKVPTVRKHQLKITDESCKQLWSLPWLVMKTSGGEVVLILILSVPVYTNCWTLICKTSFMSSMKHLSNWGNDHLNTWLSKWEKEGRRGEEMELHGNVDCCCCCFVVVVNGVAVAFVQTSKVALPCVLWCVVLCCGLVWYGMVWCSMVWCGVVWCSPDSTPLVWWLALAWHGMVWCGLVWHGVVWCGSVYTIQHNKPHHTLLS